MTAAWIRYLGASTFLFFSTTGIILNLLLVTVLYKRNAFFVITWQLIFCDLVAHSIEFIVPIPVTIAGFDIYNQTMPHLIPGFLETLSYNGSLLFSFLMTINRITVFVLPKINHFIFKEWLYVTSTVFWIFVSLIVGSFNALGCYKTFEHEGFHWQHNCPKWTDGNRFLWMVLYEFSTWIPVVMLIAYITMIILIKVKLNYGFDNGKLQKKKLIIVDSSMSSSKMNREFQLLAQGFLICGVLEIENIVFNTLPSIKLTGEWVNLVFFAGSSVSLILCSIHPIVLFTFNRDIRAGLREIIGTTTIHRISRGTTVQ